ncbi:MAG: hypothetical protein P4M15_08145 [Alphaproteobacteria bacterium]|nr:hypothetical protein [Alphaproteobacteria bacterium]
MPIPNEQEFVAEFNRIAETTDEPPLRTETERKRMYDCFCQSAMAGYNVLAKGMIPGRRIGVIFAPSRQLGKTIPT